MRERLQSFGLELHPEKTRLLGKLVSVCNGVSLAKNGARKAETFNFLGFTHISGNDRHGNFQLVTAYAPGSHANHATKGKTDLAQALGIGRYR